MCVNKSKKNQVSLNRGALTPGDEHMKSEYDFLQDFDDATYIKFKNEPTIPRCSIKTLIEPTQVTHLLE